jgi:hypothetical protein
MISIVESPQPIPHRRDTLGIFQFPWGETSDSAIYQPVFHPTSRADPVLFASLGVRSREMDPEPTEYSSSFFDDYDDEETNESSDDDFDETTLWEIASLLKSNDVPSKNSLLPPTTGVIEDYDGESDSKDPLPTMCTTHAPIHPLSVISKTKLNLCLNNLPPSSSSIVSIPQASNIAGFEPPLKMWAIDRSPETMIKQGSKIAASPSC